MSTEAATATRRARSDFKLALKRGEIEPWWGIKHELAQRMLAVELIGALPYRNVARRNERLVHHAERAADRICQRAGVNPLLRVAALDDTERQALIEAYEEYRGREA